MTFFSQNQIDKIVAETLPAGQVGERALVTAVDDRGVKIVAAFKHRERWEFQAAAEYKWDGDVNAGAKVILKW